jgi:hypothetical protein
MSIANPANGEWVSNVSNSSPDTHGDISSQGSVVGIYDRRSPICILFMNAAPTVAVGGCPSKNATVFPGLSAAIGSCSTARPMAVGLSPG